MYACSFDIYIPSLCCYMYVYVLAWNIAMFSLFLLMCCSSCIMNVVVLRLSRITGNSCPFALAQLSFEHCIFYFLMMTNSFSYIPRSCFHLISMDSFPNHKPKWHICCRYAMFMIMKLYLNLNSEDLSWYHGIQRSKTMMIQFKILNSLFSSLKCFALPNQYEPRWWCHNHKISDCQIAILLWNIYCLNMYCVCFTLLNLTRIISAELQKIVKALHQKVSNLEEEVYDWEVKIRKQDFEVSSSQTMSLISPERNLLGVFVYIFNK